MNEFIEKLAATIKSEEENYWNVFDFVTETNDDFEREKARELRDSLRHKITCLRTSLGFIYEAIGYSRPIEEKPEDEAVVAKALEYLRRR